MGELNTPVDVISVCAADGEIRPLRVRVEGEDQCLRRVDIDQVISTRKIQHVGAEAMIFLCRATVEDRPWILELKYTFRSHCWLLLHKFV